MKQIVYLITASMLLLILAGVPASAEAASAELKIVMPSDPLTPGQTITVPVVVSHVDELLAFDLKIPNNLPGVTIEIDESQTPLDGTYTPNSKPENPVQYLSWFTIEPITQDNVILCYLDITPVSGAASPLSLTVIPASFCNNDGVDLARTLTLTPAVIQLPGSSSGTETGRSSGSIADTTEKPGTRTVTPEPVETIEPATSKTVTPAASASSAPAVTPSPATTPSSTQTVPVSQTETQKASASAAGLLTVCGILAIVSRKTR